MTADINASQDIDLCLRATAMTTPLAPALSDEHSCLNWQQLDQRINQIANVLIARGLVPNDKVALLGRNSLEYALLILGCARAGICSVPLSTLSTIDSCAAMLANSGARLLFATADYYDDIAALHAQIPALDQDDMYMLDVPVEVANSLKAMLVGSSDACPAISPSPDWDFNLIYSSGTTGMPKGIMQSRAYRSIESQRIIDFCDMVLDASTIISTPLYSNTSLFVFFAVLAVGGAVHIMEKFDTTAYLTLCQDKCPTDLILVPVQYDRLLRHPDFEDFDLSSIRNKLCTSAPMAGALKQEILVRWPAGGFTEIYGMTEGGVASMLLAQNHPDKLDTVGRPVPGCDLFILDDNNKPLPQGEIGEIVGRSPTMMAGYYNQEDATKEASWYDSEGKRHQRSGDIGWLDSEGFLHLLDRKKDVIISGGFNIYAIDLENILNQHPDVNEAAVVGTSDPNWGETPVAFVVLCDMKAEPEILRKWANSRLGKAQRISEVHIIKELPRSPIGKILKRELRDQLGQSMPSK